MSYSAQIDLDKLFNNNSDIPDHPLHNFHAYPCKFPPFIPRKIIQKYAKKHYLICDPFVGSGTTLLEATLQGYSSIGFDVNPLSCLLSKVKATPLSAREIGLAEKYLNDIYLGFKKDQNILQFYYQDINHWFQTNVINELSFIRQKVQGIKNDKVNNLLSMVMSSIIVRVSNQESDTRYAAIKKKIRDYETMEMFFKKAKEVLGIYNEYYLTAKVCKIKSAVYRLDTRLLNAIDDNCVDLIITSPPYANTYDYYLYHKHRMKWLGMDYKYAQYNEIGSRREYSSLRETPQKWEEDLGECLSEMQRILKKGRFIFLVIGDSVIKGDIIKARDLIVKIAKKSALKYINCVSSDLSKHSRMFNPSFASKQKKQEHLIQLQK